MENSNTHQLFKSTSAHAKNKGQAVQRPCPNESMSYIYCMWNLGFFNTEIMEREVALSHMSQTSKTMPILMANGILLQTS